MFRTADDRLYSDPGLHMAEYTYVCRMGDTNNTAKINVIIGVAYPYPQDSLTMLIMPTLQGSMLRKCLTFVIFNNLLLDV